MLDLLIRNARIVDGTGAPSIRGDVGILQGKIAVLGQLEGSQAACCIDARGDILAPGFIDMHSHADFTLHISPTADNLVQQGVTTVVTGQCGISVAPVPPERRDEAIAANQHIRGFSGQWPTLGAWFKELRVSGFSLNLVPLVGQGTVRLAVMGTCSGAADSPQIRQMRALVERAMEDGAVGLSTGLTYVPGCFSDIDELVAILAPMRDAGLYFTHMRGSGDALLDAVREGIEIGGRASVGVELSHFKAAGRPNWGKAAAALALIEDARSSGEDVSSDMYPYTAGSTSLRAMLPDWAQEGTVQDVLARLGDRAQRERMCREMKSTTPYSHLKWDEVLITEAPGHREWEGEKVADLAAAQGVDSYMWVLDALRSDELTVQIAMFMMSEENVEMQLAKPYMMIGSDGWGLSTEGPLAAGKPHPRCYGTFPRLLAEYVRNRRIIPLEDAIRKVTGAPAEKLGLRNRGLIKPGYWADLVLFDPDGIQDTATYESPHQYPKGIRCVIVNGDVVVESGHHTGSYQGTIVGG